jgi:hypothetical protein
MLLTCSPAAKEARASLLQHTRSKVHPHPMTARPVLVNFDHDNMTVRVLVY